MDLKHLKSEKIKLTNYSHITRSLVKQVFENRGEAVLIIFKLLYYNNILLQSLQLLGSHFDHSLLTFKLIFFQ